MNAAARVIRRGPLGRRRLVVTVAAVITLTAGCGGHHAAPEPARSRPVNPHLEFTTTINYGAFGSTAEVDCAAGKVLNVTGSNNTLRAKGSCAAVNISGADNRLTLNEVTGTIGLTGINNTVSYHRGDPQVDNRGSGNRVARR